MAEKGIIGNDKRVKDLTQRRGTPQSAQRESHILSIIEIVQK
jgi:hypothetical protein